MAENKLFEILAKFTKREDGVDHAARSMSLNIMVSNNNPPPLPSSYPATDQPHSIPILLHYKAQKTFEKSRSYPSQQHVPEEK